MSRRLGRGTSLGADRLVHWWRMVERHHDAKHQFGEEPSLRISPSCWESWEQTRTLPESWEGLKKKGTGHTRIDKHKDKKK